VLVHLYTIGQSSWSQVENIDKVVSTTELGHLGVKQLPIFI